MARCYLSARSLVVLVLYFLNSLRGVFSMLNQLPRGINRVFVAIVLVTAISISVLAQTPRPTPVNPATLPPGTQTTPPTAPPGAPVITPTQQPTPITPAIQEPTPPNFPDIQPQPLPPLPDLSRVGII